MLVLCSKTPHQSPLSGPHGPYDHNRGNGARKEGREPASLSDSDAVPFDLLFQPFCKLCELQARISFQRETRDCCIICRETWMYAMVPDSAIELTGFSMHRSNRTKELTGKSRDGASVSISTTCGVMKGTYTQLNPSAPLIWNFICFCVDHSGYRGNFTAIIITAVYIPPQANTDQALKELYGNISEQEIVHPDATFVVTGDFNKANFRTTAPKYFLSPSTPSTFRQIGSLFRSAPACYRQKLKLEAPTLRTIQCWSNQLDAILQDCFDHVDWDMFRAVSDDDIEAYSDSVTCFIRKCIEDIDKNNLHLPQPKTMD